MDPGKSTLTRLTAGRRPGAVIRLLDDPATLQSAKDGPTDFVDRDALMIIDEIQLAPELLRPIKVEVDLNPTRAASCSPAPPGCSRCAPCRTRCPAAWR
jgi:predicted AAA+ superfamily ATPase